MAAARDPVDHTRAAVCAAWVHEHGTNPRAFRFFRKSGTPAFGRTSTFAGDDEPHSWTLLPHPGCGSVYQEWGTALNVGGALRGNPGFAIDNPTTQFDPASPRA